MKAIVILAAVAASCAAHGVYLGETPSVTLRCAEKIDLSDVTRTPIGYILQDGSGLETATNWLHFHIGNIHKYGAEAGRHSERSPRRV